MTKVRDLKTRFESKFLVTPGCWIWLASRNNDGYGSIRVNRKTLRAHRISYEIYVGAIPEGYGVLHRCDNPTCVNPNHLFVGTHKENMDDRTRKSRHHCPAGEKHGRAKLTKDQVETIRSICIKGSREFGTVALSKMFGVSPDQIQHIVNRTSWKEAA